MGNISPRKIKEKKKKKKLVSKSTPLQFSERNNHTDFYLGTVLWELKLVPTTLLHTGSVSLNLRLPMKKITQVEMYMTTKNTMTLGHISDVLRIDTGQLRSLHSPSSLLVLASTAGKRLLSVTWIFSEELIKILYFLTACLVV